jgi:hypothetical protein
VFHSETANRDKSTFTHFDSGALANPWYLEPANGNPAWSNWSNTKERQDFLEDHTGFCTELNEVTLHYLNGHFRDVKDYVKLPQRSKPDWAPFHGLKCTDGKEDRRAWTIEVRIPHHIPLQELQALIFADEGVLNNAPDEFLANDPRIIVVPKASSDAHQPEESLDPLQVRISKFIIDEYF